MSWLTLALGLVKFLNWATSYLDAQSKEKVIRELVQSEMMKDDLATIAKADAARAAVDPTKLRDPDPDSRT